ncbi:MAG: hypothetical protein SFV22_16120, partial [Saprospiraceae bacterium]|nr:hypothetical protein [Saprospiraceae bacterium]
MVKMSNGNRKQMYENKILDTKPNHCKRQILNGSVNYVLHEMVSQMRGKPHLYYRVVNLFVRAVDRPDVSR